MVETSDLAAQVTAYERALRRRAGDRVVVGGDPTFADLQQVIRDRRWRRSSREGEGVGSHRVDDELDEASAAEGAGRILAIEPFGPTVRVFRIGRPAGFAFRPGQHLELGAPGGRREDFSIASAPHQPHLELAIELRPGGKVTPALFALVVGDPVDLGGSAKGKLQLDAAASHHLMIATVTGIAPLRSMVLDALHRGAVAGFTILHGASLATELCFHDELVALAAADERVTYVPTVSRPDEAANRSWTGSTGRVDVLARQVVPGLDPATTRVYAVGNAGMIDAVAHDLGSAGFGVSSESYGS
jgi:NAD(P)H-flavin reductase